MNTATLILERFLEMLDERGLSSHQYTHTLSNNQMNHMIDVCKDGKVLATYNTGIFHYFSEGDMSQALDKIIGE